MKRINLDLANIPDRSNPNNPFSPTSIHTEAIESLRIRADILTGSDRAIMKAYLETGSTFVQIARIARVSETTIARRIHKLSHRLLDGHYVICLRHKRILTPLELAIARDHFLQGISQKNIAYKRKISVYRIRKIIHKLSNLKLLQRHKHENLPH